MQTIRANKMIQGVNSAFSPDHSVLNFGSPATQLQYRRRRRPACAATLHRPVHESPFRASQEVGYTKRLEIPSRRRLTRSAAPPTGPQMVL